MEKAITLYNASAGSGKTYQLVKTYLLILIKDKDIYAFQKILALTFTNKAAEEMKSRLIDWLMLLSDAANNQSPLFLQIKEETGLEEKKLNDKTKQILTAILHRYSQLSIGTLDAFFYKLLRSFSKELGINFNSEIVLDTKPYIRKAIRKLVQNAEKDNNLKSFLVESLNSEMERSKNWNIIQGIEDKFSGLLDDNQYEKMKPFAAMGFDQYMELQKKWKKDAILLSEKIKNYGISFFTLLKEHSLDENDLKGKKNGFFGFFKKLSEGNFAFPTDAVIKTVAEESYTAKSLEKAKQEKVLAISGEISVLFADAFAYIKKLDELESMQNELIPLALSGGLIKTLEEQKSKEKLLFISDVAKIISENLIDQPSAYLYEKIGQKYSTIFIDEFQDTSSMQWKNINPLIEEKAAYGQSTILVGDPKQAIYRFRGGDQKILVALSNEESVSTKTLETNYRSCKAIVEFNNSFYQYLLSEFPEGNYKNIYTQGLNQKAHSKKEGFVEAEFIAKTEEKSEYEILNTLLEKVKTIYAGGYNPQDICILVRDNKEAYLVSEFLQANNNSVVTDNAFVLEKNTSIDLIVRFLYLLTDTENKKYKYEFICRFIPFYDYKPTEDLSAFINMFCSMSWAENILFLNSEGFTLSKDLFIKENLFALVQHCMASLNLKRGAYLMKFLDYIEKYKNRLGNNLKYFLEYWEENKSKVNVEGESSKEQIRVMTMHKSKGLEFPIVLIPFFPKKTNQDSTWLSYPDLPFPYYRMKLKKNLSPTNPIAGKELREEELSQEIDVLNLLYVTTTRAVEQMYFLVPEDGKSSMISLMKKYFASIDLTPGNSRTIGGFFHEKEKNKSEKIEQKSIILKNIRTETAKIKFSTDGQKYFSSSNAATKRGNAWHKLLSYYSNEKATEKVLDIQARKKMLEAEDAAQLPFVLSTLSQREDLKPLYAANLTSYNEKEFMLVNGKIIKPDRIVLHEDKWWILDYKTGNKSSKYTEQLYNYAKGLLELGIPIGSCLLIYLDLDLQTEILTV